MPRSAEKRSPPRPARPLLAACLALLWPGAAAALTVSPGDVLAVSVLQAPALAREAKVDAGGRIMLPMLGSLEVAGLDLDGVRERLRRALIDGALVRDPEVTVEFAAYRPVYVAGAVAQSGGFPFAPGMTVRQGIVLAGGLERGSAPLAPGTEEAVRLSAETRSVSYRLLQAESRIARLRAELRDTGTLDTAGIAPGLAGPAAEGEILALERELLSDSRARSAALQAHSDSLQELVRQELRLLERQSALQRSEQAALAEDLRSARDLQARGVISITRVKELERQSRLLASDMLDTQAYAARARQTSVTVRYDRERAEIERRVTVQSSLVEALAQRDALAAELQALTARLLAAGLPPPQGPAELPAPLITIYREAGYGGAGAGTERIAGGLDTPVEPGDVIEVAFAPVPPT
ncbi:polysaccharide biosynthesis/export family protein [Oceanicella sp. SM1341]|uniref:polysaccharide biosynthesis/export family protein n=1 Tax=Oceanicella sp. SM1341 TaxID=1548889 RepID=UPI000E54EEBD|nr:polysaccharide biosynthesis/export family protein [Oceanicella sp. SM1341]